MDGRLRFIGDDALGRSFSVCVPDATLVRLAEGLDVHDILTLDRRGFSTYRSRRRRAFKLVLI